MVYLLKCAKDKSVSMQVEMHNEVVEFKIMDEEIDEMQSIYLSKKDVFELVGILHYIQKQLK